MSIEKEQAFPFLWEDRHGDSYGESGLSKLEYFAGLAMQGICVNAGRNGHEFTRPEFIASTAIICAEALIAELEKHNE